MTIRTLDHTQCECNRTFSQEQARALWHAAASALWVFNNLHAVDDPAMREQFKRFAKAAENDCRSAYDLTHGDAV